MKIDELRIRNVDAIVIAKLDELARKKGISRNTYVKTQLEQFCIMAEIKQQEEKYVTIINSLTELLIENTNTMITVKRLLEERGI